MGNVQCFFVLFFFDQLEELFGIGDVGVFIYIDKQGVFVFGKWFQIRQVQWFFLFWNFLGWVFGDCIGNGFNVIRLGIVVFVDNVQEVILGKIFDDFGYFFGGLVVFIEFVGQVCVWVGVDKCFSFG